LSIAEEKFTKAGQIIALLKEKEIKLNDK
jgi:hypothetical protein